jgi:hypothetical protein
MGSDASADFVRIIELLSDGHVDFIVIGGQAETLFGSPRMTQDTDVCYSRAPENLARLAEAIASLQPRLRGAPPELPFKLDARTLQMGMNFTLDTEAGPLDLLGYVEPIGAFDRLSDRAEAYAIGDREVRTIALDDLIAVKRHVGRVKDRESLAQLLAIKQLRDSEGLR